MIIIEMNVCGDRWLNPRELEETILTSDPTEHIILDFRSEGPSLKALGIVDMLDRLCTQINRDIKTIWLDNFSNSVEILPYQRANHFRMSHFLWMSEKYWREAVPTDRGAKLLGLFVGRRSLSRLAILYDVYHHYKDCSLLSCMNNHRILPVNYANDRGIDLDFTSGWTDTYDVDALCRWYDSDPVSSIDGHTIQDQYVNDKNTNADLLNHYHKFQIELVAETYTIGECFFPTEKTVRPLMAGKPCLIYGPPGYLKKLQDMGFYTWHKIWDESYDALQGVDRWIEMKNTINEIIKNGYDYQTSKSIAVHNHRMLKQLAEKYKPK